MRIVTDFKEAKRLLSRKGISGDYSVPPALKKGLKQIFGTEDPEQAVRQIIDEVRSRGDAALFDLTLKIDCVQLESLEVSRQQVSEARRQVESRLISALKLAADQIYNFHIAQRDGLLSGVARMGSFRLFTFFCPLSGVGSVSLYRSGCLRVHPPFE